MGGDKLGTPDDLPDVGDAHDQAAKLVTDRLEELRAQNQKQAQDRLEKLETERQLRITLDLPLALDTGEAGLSWQV